MVSETVVNDDSALIEQTLRGRPDAFSDLVRRYQDRLYNALVHLLGDMEEARDVAQEAFVQAFVKLDTFQRHAAFFTWLYRIAFNRAVSRQRRRRPAASLDEARQQSGHEPVDADPPPSHRLEQDDTRRQVREALSALDEDFRVVLVLREIDDRSYEEIAEILDLPVGTVRSRLHRARLQMRDELKKVMAGENQQ